MDIGKSIKRAGRRIGRQAERAGDSIDATATRLEQGRIFGDSVYGRYASNITGLTTASRLVRRARNHEQISVDDVVHDGKVMRPGMGYSKAADDVQEQEVDAPARRMAQEQDRQRAAMEDFNKGQIAARVRRSRTERPYNRGGTMNTGALGVPGGGVGNGAFAALLGL